MKSTAFSARRYDDPKRPNAKWVVTGPKIQGKRWRRFFATDAEAKAFMQLRKVERENHGSKALEFDERLRVETLECAEILRSYGVGLREAVQMVLPILKSRKRSCLAEQLVREVLAAKAKDGASTIHLQDLRTRLAVFSRHFGGRLVADLTTAELDDWLRGLPVGAVSRNNFRKVTRTAFSFAVSRGYCTANPMTATARAKVKDVPPGILTPEQSARLLESAGPEILPYLAIGLFAGLRRAELEKLDWKEVDLSAGHIEVIASKSKTAKRRFVTIEPNLAAWITPYALQHGPLTPPNIRHYMKAARLAAGVAEWPSNALRHSFASYHLAAFHNAAKTALEMGHVNSGLLFGHYRELVKSKDAGAFWKIRPAVDSAEKIVSIMGSQS